ncbi:MAG: putative toxin-antitoxin system toxin component, PIN family [Pyrinomonadaceae bacterium]
MTDIPVAVFDCGVFLQGLISKAGPAVACLELVEKESIRLAISEEVLAEIDDVLSRSHLRRRHQNLTDEKVEKLINMLLERSRYVEKIPRHFSYSRDPNDEPYLNLAIEIESDYIVSRDNDLLDLMTGHTDEAKEFRQKYRSIRVIEPSKFLNKIKKRKIE